MDWVFSCKGGVAGGDVEEFGGCFGSVLGFGVCVLECSRRHSVLMEIVVLSHLQDILV